MTENEEVKIPEKLFNDMDRTFKKYLQSLDNVLKLNLRKNIFLKEKQNKVFLMN